MSKIMAWATISIETLYWPSDKRHLHYDGEEFTLLPRTRELPDCVMFEYEQGPRDEWEQRFDEALTRLRQFISRLAWAIGQPIEEVAFSGGTQPMRARVVRPDLPAGSLHNVDDLPVPPHDRAKLALALYREALISRNVPYQFLSYFKIINIVNSSGPDIENWINNSVTLLKDSAYFTKHIQNTNHVINIGKYLYEQGRCAIAHANANPIVDPEDPSDLRRLRNDMPLIKALAEHIIEHDFGFKRYRPK